MTGDDAQVSVDTLREDVSGDAVLVTVAAADVRAVLDRLAELESLRAEPIGTAWGVRWPDGHVSLRRTEEGARREVAATGRELVSRPIPAWTPVSP